jgi:hypothetical protein
MNGNRAAHRPDRGGRDPNAAVGTLPGAASRSWRPCRPPRGQATVECLIGTLLIVPVLLGLLAFGTLQGLRQATAQASRFAAFDQALGPRGSDPSAVAARTRLSRAVLLVAQARRDGTPARIEDDLQRDPSAGLPAATLWRDPRGMPLLAGSTAIDVRLDTVAPAGALVVAQDTAGRPFALTAARIGRAEVRAQLAPLDAFTPLAGITLQLQSTTAVAGDAWQAAGSTDVRQRVDAARRSGAGGAAIALTHRLSPVTDLLVALLEPVKGPQWGCIDPDVVPPDRLAAPTAPLPCGD